MALSKLKTLFAVPIACGTVFTLSEAATAAGSEESLAVTPIYELEATLGSESPLQLAQITSVSELADVLPTDWAF